jgi:hypothetical protein
LHHRTESQRKLTKLVNGQGGVVRLNNGVGNLGRRNNGEGGHHTVGELLTDLGDQKGTHTGTSTTTERVGDLETLEAVASLSLTADNVQNLVNELGTLSVVTLRPVVTGTGLSENEVVGTEQLTERTSTDRIHGTGLQVDEDGTRNVLVASSLVEVDVHALELEVARSVVAAAATVNLCQNNSSRAKRYTYTPEPSRPCSPEMVCQKEAPIWLPWEVVSTSRRHRERDALAAGATYTLAGLDVQNLTHVDYY